MYCKRPKNISSIHILTNANHLCFQIIPPHLSLEKRYIDEKVLLKVLENSTNSNHNANSRMRWKRNSVDVPIPTGRQNDQTMPKFTSEPPLKVHFSNTTGTVLDCVAIGGSSRPIITWITQDGRPVNQVM